MTAKRINTELILDIKENATRDKKTETTVIEKHIHIISGLIFKREVSCDQKRGIEPRFWTTELIRTGDPSAISSNTICSVSTSFATRPFSLTPRLRYLISEIFKQQSQFV